MLRSDVTLFLAKQMGMILSGEDLPLRLWYADTILRHQDAEDISKNEFFQVGAELIGKQGSYADLEILLLLVKSLEKANLKSYFIHLGSREIFDRCFRGLSEELKKNLLRAVSHRDRSGIDEILTAFGFDAKVRDFYLRFFLFIGGPEKLAAIEEEGKRDCHLSREILASLDYLAGIWKELKALGVADHFRLDLSEVGGQPLLHGPRLSGLQGRRGTRPSPRAADTTSFLPGTA